MLQESRTLPAICFSRLCFRLVKSWVTETFFNPFTGFCQIHCNVTLVPSVLRGEQLPRESDTSALQELGMPLDTRTAGMPHLARKLFLTTMLPTRPIWRHCARATSDVKHQNCPWHWQVLDAVLCMTSSDGGLQTPQTKLLHLFWSASWWHCQYITSLTQR